jgi:hypothetical protein
MVLQWEKIEPIISQFCLFLLLVFMLTAGIPVIGYLMQIAAIMALIFLAVRRRFFLLTAGTVGSLVLAIMLYNFSFTLLGMWGMVVAPAMILGGMIVAGVPPARALLTAIFVSVAVSMTIFWMQKDLIYSAIDNSMEIFVSLLNNIGQDNQSGKNLIDEIEAIFRTVKRLMPSLIALSGATQLFLGWVGMILLFRFFDKFLPTLNSFIFWKMPYNFIYVIGAFIVLRLIGGEILAIIADNVLVFLGFFYAVFGFSLFEYYLKKIRLSPFLRILFYIGFIFLQLPGLIGAALVGLFDSYFDFRKVRARIIG